MSLKHLSLLIAASFLLSSLGPADLARASKRFSLIGGGGQTHIGGGLMMPIQAAAGPGTTTSMFPNLRIPVNGIPIVTGTLAKTTLLTTAGGKQGYQRRLNVPAGVLRKLANKSSVGVKAHSLFVFAVQTNLDYSWPAAPAVFSTGNAVATTTIGPSFGGTMTYSNALGARFGGAAQFAISSGDPVAGDAFPAAPVTLWIKVNATTPPCTHPAFGGAKAGCVAAAVLEIPGPVGAIGGASNVTVMTPGVVIPGNNLAAMKMGAVPLGTLLAPPLVAGKLAIPTNMVSSRAGPWTTGRVIISNPPEIFTLSGNDLRTAGGGGTIQMVAGSLSTRATMGANANRGWVRLVLSPQFPVPATSLSGLAATVALMLLAFGYTMRRRLFR
jgi:hypothetical protein